MTITINPGRATVVGAAVLLCVGLISAGMAFGSRSPAPAVAAAGPTGSTGVGQGITVSGKGTVSGTPDALTLQLGVSVHGDTVSQALAKANSSTAKVQKSLLGDGVKRADLATSGLSVQPDYSASSNGVPHGYQVTESVSATLRDLGRAGDAITRAVTAGGNAARVDGVSLDLSDDAALVDSARDRAFADAKAKAQQYAKAAGRSLGAVQNISESVTTPTPYYDKVAAGSLAAAPSPVPIQAGSQNVDVEVTVLFSLA
jgi:uncharacterized protein